VPGVRFGDPVALGPEAEAVAMPALCGPPGLAEPPGHAGRGRQRLRTRHRLGSGGRVAGVKLRLRRTAGRFLTVLAPGFSCCLRCRMPWRFTHPHITHYSFVTLPSEAMGSIILPGAGCFPLCEYCWTDLGNPDARWPYYVALLDLWESEHGVEPETRAAVNLAVEAGR